MKQTRSTKASGSSKGCLYLLLSLIIILIPSSPSKFPSGINYSRVTLAGASYLEDAGRFSEIMNQFVDVLLEKVSFLAEIIIQSSLEEQCLTDEQLKCQQMSKPLKNSLLDSENLSEKFDSLEFTNIDRFVDSLDSKKGKSNFRQAESSCKLFSLAVNQQDLPVKRMELCCLNFQSCYMECGKKKHDCDLEFQQCLKSMCKQHFDYTNDTVLREIHSILRRQAPSNEPLASDDDDDELMPDDSEDGRTTGGCNGGEKSVSKGVGTEPGCSSTTATSSTSSKPPSFEASSHEVKRLKDKYKACKLAIKVLIIGNLAFGCQAYKQSQWTACCKQD